MKPVALVGMPGVGKSTVGRALASLMGVSFVDTDWAVENIFGMTPADILRKNGERALREYESEVLNRTLTVEVPCVIATGGGMFCDRDMRERLLLETTVIWLVAPIPVLAARIEGGDRPLLDRDGLVATLAARSMYYYEAHGIVSALGDPQQIAEKILKKVIDKKSFAL